MFEFSRGPLVWLAFLIFFVGSAYRIVSIIITAKQDKVVLPYMKWKFGLRSIAHWIVPFASRNMRMRPAFVILSFLFHGCLILTPILTVGHVMLWKESWQISWWSLPDFFSKLMTSIVLVGGIAFALRRIANPTVRFVSTAGDFVLILVVLAPFATGLMAFYHLFSYQTMIIIHIWAGAIWLAIIPFTRIAHMLFFPLTRAYMGCESGYVRNARDW